ncbi:MAG TPA: 30S ribosomal protein S20 [Atribacteraceae bacterium]|nr:30S ribosomal protein S20 [Atribacteraceae bacterium]
MPNTKSALKSLYKNRKRRLQNRIQMSTTKTLIKKFTRMVDEGKLAEARLLIPQVAKQVDMVASKGVFHKNKAGRIKSRLTRRLNRATAAS